MPDPIDPSFLAGFDEPGLPHVMATLALHPVLAGLSREVLSGLAQQMTDHLLELEPGLEVRPRPGVLLLLVGHGGELAIRRTRPGAAAGAGGDYEGAPWPAKASWGVPVFGGDVLVADLLDCGVELTPRRPTWLYEVGGLRADGRPDPLTREISAKIGAATLEKLREMSVLAASPDFRLLSIGQRAEVADATHRRAWSPGEVLLPAGEPPTELMVLASTGVVEVTRRCRSGGPAHTYLLGFGDTVGIPSLARGPEPWDSVEVRARTPVEALVLPRDRAGALWRKQRAWFPAFAKRLLATEREACALVRSMATSPLLSDVAPARLFPVLQGAERLRWRVDDPPPTPAGRVPGICMVRSGELAEYRLGAEGPLEAMPVDGPNPEVLSWARAGEVALERSMVEPRRPTIWAARLPGEMVYVRREHLVDVLGSDSGFVSGWARLADGWSQAQRRHSALCAAARPARMAVFRGLSSPLGADAARSLLKPLAAEIEGAFAERCLVVTVKTGAKRARRREPDGRSGAVTVRVGSELPDLLEALSAWVPGGKPPVARVLVHPAPGVATEPLVDAADRLVLVQEDGPATAWPPHRSPRTPWVIACVARPGEAFAEAATPPDDGLAPGQSGYPPVTVRLRTLGRALELEPPSVARLARAVTGRLVGVALGGGGAWGYAHVPVLLSMEGRGIPIDLVSGSSFGAVVGAYYACRGVEGLVQLLKTQDGLSTAVLKGMVTTVALEDFLDEALGAAELTSLPIPFLPVATDLAACSEHPLHVGCVGRGVRASGSFPPVYPTTVDRGVVLVDGGLSANVPATALVLEGAAMVVSSAIVPAPTAVAPQRFRWPGRVGEVITDLNPVSRIAASFQGAVTLVHTAGTFSSAMARVHFETVKSDTWPWQFADAFHIIRDTMSNPGFWANVEAMEASWEEVRRPCASPPP